MPRSGRRPSAELLQGPIPRALLRLAGPVVLANVLQTVYQLTDMFWVGRLGAEAVAAVAFSFPILFLLSSVGMGVTIAGTILVAQHEGRGETSRVNHVAAQTYLLATLLAVLLAAAGVLLTTPLLDLLGAEAAVLGMAADYLRLSFLGLPFVYGYFVFQALLRGVGDVRTPLVVVAGTVVLNFLLDPLFILGWGPGPALGVAGAAAATLGTQGLAAAIGAFLLLRGQGTVRLQPRELWPDPELLARIVRLGFPASVEQSTRAFGLAVLTSLVAGFGDQAVAAYGIGTRIFSFVLIPALGLAMATSTLVGQNIGARQVERARHTVVVGGGIALVVLTAVGIGAAAWGDLLVSAFLPGEPEVVALGARFLLIMAPSWGLIGLHQVIGGGFSGAGKTFVSMTLALVSLWALRFPLAFLLSMRTDLGLDGIWWAFPASNVLAAALAVGWFARDRWHHLAATPEQAEDDAVEAEAMEEAVVERPIE